MESSYYDGSQNATRGPLSICVVWRKLDRVWREIHLEIQLWINLSADWFSCWKWHCISKCKLPPILSKSLNNTNWERIYEYSPGGQLLLERGRERGGRQSMKVRNPHLFSITSPSHSATETDGMLHSIQRDFLFKRLTVVMGQFHRKMGMVILIIISCSGLHLLPFLSSDGGRSPRVQPQQHLME